jgi:peptide/nickel transport system ATP-binding protein
VSALDLSTQARVLDLFIEIQREIGCAYLFVSHDLSVIRHVSHRVMVLYRGQLVEAGDAESITSSPQEDYTRRLMMSAPVPDPAAQRERREELQRLRNAERDLAAPAASA